MIAWLGTVSSVIGAFLVAFGIMSIGYVFFAVGALSWLIVAVLRRDMALFSLNAIFFCANIIGLYRNPFN